MKNKQQNLFQICLLFTTTFCPIFQGMDSHEKKAKEDVRDQTRSYRQLRRGIFVASRVRGYCQEDGN